MILQRIRTNPISRPDSKVFTRIFESELVGSDGYLASSTDEIQSISEEYPVLVRSCEELRLKNKELVNQISNLEKIHEHEIVRLSDQLEELKQECSIYKKSEKDLQNVTSKLRFQLSNSDDQMSRMNKEINSLQDHCHKVKHKWDIAVGESEKLRTQLNLKEEELRYAHQSIRSHASDLRKWESDRQLHEDVIKKLNLELHELQSTREILEEQKQANLELKATIDKLKFELEEQRARYAGSSVADSRPTSVAGSLSKSLGAELAQLSGIDELKTADQCDDEDDELSETTADDTDDLTRIVRSLSEPNDLSHDHEIFEEIRIKRIKRRKTLTSGNSSLEFDGAEAGQGSSTLEKVIELQDASTDTHDLIAHKSCETQTDPIPEPPPVYRPKMEDSQVQTDQSFLSSSSDDEIDGDHEIDPVQRSLLRLVTGLDPKVLELAIDHIHKEMMVNPQNLPGSSARTTGLTTIIDHSTSGSSGLGSSSPSTSEADSDSESKPNSCSIDRSTTAHVSYFSRWGLSAAVQSLSILSPYSILNSLPSFGFLKSDDRQAEVTPTPHDPELQRPRKSKRNKPIDPKQLMGAREGRIKRNLRICSSMIIFLAAGYFLGNLIFPPTPSPVTFQCCPPSSSGPSSCLLEALKGSNQLGRHYSVEFLSSSSSSGIVGGVGSGSGSSQSTHHANLIPSSFIRFNSTSFNDLVDFNSVGIGREGFIVQLRHRIGLLIWLKNLGTSVIWNTVSGYPKIPT